MKTQLTPLGARTASPADAERLRPLLEAVHRCLCGGDGDARGCRRHRAEEHGHG